MLEAPCRPSSPPPPASGRRIQTRFSGTLLGPRIWLGMMLRQSWRVVGTRDGAWMRYRRGGGRSGLSAREVSRNLGSFDLCTFTPERINLQLIRTYLLPRQWTDRSSSFRPPRSTRQCRPAFQAQLCSPVLSVLQVHRSYLYHVSDNSPSPSPTSATKRSLALDATLDQDDRNVQRTKRFRAWGRSVDQLDTKSYDDSVDNTMDEDFTDDVRGSVERRLRRLSLGDSAEDAGDLMV